MALIMQSIDPTRANFREVRCGTIAHGILFRSSHPIEYDWSLPSWKTAKQSKTLAILAQQAHINSIINLSDTDTTVQKFLASAPWYQKIYLNHHLIAVSMHWDIGGKSFNQKMRRALKFMISHSGPYLIHCYAGMDRTGFVCAVLEALMDATIKDITADYLKSYDSGFNSVLDDGQYDDNAEIILEQLRMMNDYSDVNDKILASVAEQYLTNDVGLTSDEIGALKRRLEGGMV